MVLGVHRGSVEPPRIVKNFAQLGLMDVQNGTAICKTQQNSNISVDVLDLQGVTEMMVIGRTCYLTHGR